MIPRGKSYHRRKVYAWRDPLPKQPGYASPHCAHGACKICRRDSAALERYRTAQVQAAAAASMFDPWDMKIGGHQEQLGPSAPSAWIQTFVKEA